MGTTGCSSHTPSLRKCYLLPSAEISNARGMHLCLGARKLAILAFMAVGGEISVPIPAGKGVIMQDFSVKLGGFPDISTAGIRPGTTEHGFLCGQLVFNWDQLSRNSWEATLLGIRDKKRDPRQTRQTADKPGCCPATAEPAGHAPGAGSPSPGWAAGGGNGPSLGGAAG